MSKLKVLDAAGAVLLDQDIPGDVTVTLGAAAAPIPVPPPPAPTPPPPAPTPPPPTPPAPPPAPGDISVTRLDTVSDGNGPPTGPNQFLNISLSGSGTTASSVKVGDQYRADFSGSLADGDRDNNLVFCVRRSPTGVGVALCILDRIDLPDGAYFESFYLGWTQGSGTPLGLFSVRRIMAILAWVRATYPQIGPAISISGGSMGAWGSNWIGVRHAADIAMVYASRPIWRSSVPAGTVSIPNYPAGPYTHPAGTLIATKIDYPIASAPPLSAIDGGGSSAAYLDLIAYVANPANKLPFIGWCCGRHDGYSPFQDHVDAAVALRAAKRPFAFAWNDGDHGAGDIIHSVLDPYGYDGFQLGKGMPYLSNCSLDKDPAVDLVGGINIGFTIRSIVDTAAQFSFQIKNAQACTVMVEPSSSVFTGDRTPKSLTLAAGVWQTVNFEEAAAPAAPVPSPTPSPAVGQIMPAKLALNPAMTIVFADYFQGGEAYEREARCIVMTGASRQFKIVAIDATQSGAYRAFDSASYGLTVDGAEVLAFTAQPGDKAVTVTLPLTGLAEGWHRLGLRTPATETAMPMWAYMQPGPTPAKQDWTPAQMSSHGTFHGLAGKMNFHAMVPAVFKPTVAPLVPRETPAFSDSTTNRKTLIQTDLVPWRPDDLYRTRITGGVLNTANQQAYYWASLAGAKYPGLALLDGPRGAGSLAMATHLQVSHTGGAWFCDPWRFGSISADGTIKTLAGWRHQPPAPRPQPVTPEALEAACELVGDWSAIPEERRGFHELWGAAWDQRTLAIDPNAPPVIINGQPFQPHLVGPAVFLADAQNGRICRVEFTKNDFDAPGKVTEFVTGLNDPWDVVYGDGVLYVSERQDNLIGAYDATTGAHIRDVVTGAMGLASVDQSRFIVRKVSIDVIRAQPCVLPEGLYLQDGWLYFGTIAMGQVRRVNLASGAIETIVPDIVEYSRGGTNLCKIAVSDGTFGPRGTVFFVTWSIKNQGRPRAYLPNGTEWGWNSVTAGDGPGRGWETMGYGCAVAVGKGMLLASFSNEGVTKHSKALPTDGSPVKTADWDRMRAAYQTAGLEITHGPGGYGYYGLPLPWGVSADIDAYLMAYGHKKP